jgi:Na+-transporting methylmalonyl-CoA/oxaloacetate decarboxylase gamma subunit
METSKWTFGLTMMIVGMGGTFLTLWILGVAMDLLKKVFPFVDEAAEKAAQAAARAGSSEKP